MADPSDKLCMLLRTVINAAEPISLCTSYSIPSWLQDITLCAQLLQLNAAGQQLEADPESHSQPKMHLSESPSLPAESFPAESSHQPGDGSHSARKSDEEAPFTINDLQADLSNISAVSRQDIGTSPYHSTAAEHSSDEAAFNTFSQGTSEESDSHTAALHSNSAQAFVEAEQHQADDSHWDVDFEMSGASSAHEPHCEPEPAEKQAAADIAWADESVVSAGFPSEAAAANHPPVQPSATSSLHTDADKASSTSSTAAEAATGSGFTHDAAMQGLQAGADDWSDGAFDGPETSAFDAPEGSGSASAPGMQSESETAASPAHVIHTGFSHAEAPTHQSRDADDAETATATADQASAQHGASANSAKSMDTGIVNGSNAPGVGEAAAEGDWADVGSRDEQDAAAAASGTRPANGLVEAGVAAETELNAAAFAADNWADEASPEEQPAAADAQATGLDHHPAVADLDDDDWAGSSFPTHEASAGCAQLAAAGTDLSEAGSTAKDISTSHGSAAAPAEQQSGADDWAENAFPEETATSETQKPVDGQTSVEQAGTAGDQDISPHKAVEYTEQQAAAEDDWGDDDFGDFNDAVEEDGNDGFGAFNEADTAAAQAADTPAAQSIQSAQQQIPKSPTGA